MPESVYSVEESDLEELDFGCTLDTRYKLEELNLQTSQEIPPLCNINELTEGE